MHLTRLIGALTLMYIWRGGSSWRRTRIFWHITLRRSPKWQRPKMPQAASSPVCCTISPNFVVHYILRGRAHECVRAWISLNARRIVGWSRNANVMPLIVFDSVPAPTLLFNMQHWTTREKMQWFHVVWVSMGIGRCLQMHLLSYGSEFAKWQEAKRWAQRWAAGPWQ